MLDYFPRDYCKNSNTYLCCPLFCKGHSMTGKDSNSESECDTYCTQYNRQAGDSLSLTLLRAVVAVTNTPPTELDPLFDHIDPDALDALFHPTCDGTPRQGQGRLTIQVHNCDVTVYAGGCIKIQPPNE